MADNLENINKPAGAKLGAVPIQEEAPTKEQVNLMHHTSLQGKVNALDKKLDIFKAEINAKMDIVLNNQNTMPRLIKSAKLDFAKIIKDMQENFKQEMKTRVSVVDLQYNVAASGIKNNSDGIKNNSNLLKTLMVLIVALFTMSTTFFTAWFVKHF